MKAVSKSFCFDSDNAGPENDRAYKLSQYQQCWNQCFSKHELEDFFIFGANLSSIFSLQMRWANDQSNDRVERERLFCFVREETLTSCHSSSLVASEVATQPNLPHSSGSSFTWGVFNKTCFQPKEKRAIKARPHCEDDPGICKFCTDGVTTTWCPSLSLLLRLRCQQMLRVEKKLGQNICQSSLPAS